MGNHSGAQVIVLRSHPLWIAAQQQARERGASMRRHPTARLRVMPPVTGGRAARRAHNFRVLTSTNTPA